MSVLLGLDIGTTGARAVAIDASGVVRADASASYPLLTPRPGWAEQHPADWWEAAKDVLTRVCAAVPGEIVGLGLTGQMHGAVFLDEEDAVIRPAILWNDQRTAAQCAAITERVGAARLLAIAGNPALTGFQAPKILWLRDEERENYARVRRVLLPKDYVRLCLTGEYATDASDASGTLLLDVRAREWSVEILNALDIPIEWLPKVYEGTKETGRVRDAIWLPSVSKKLRGTGRVRDVMAWDLGLPSGFFVTAGGGDNVAAAVGVGAVREGILMSSIGTSGVLFAHTDTFAPDPTGRIHAFCHSVPGAYHAMGVTLAAGGALRWWREIIGPDATYQSLADAAATVPPGAEGLLFLPYLMGERTPHLDPAARGAFVGLTARHAGAHLARAVMEGVMFSLRDGLEIMRGLRVPIAAIRATGGGARHPLWRQLQADILGLPVMRPTVAEGPAFGAALLAGVGAGCYRDVADACARVTLRDDMDEPEPTRAHIYDAYYDVYRSLYPNLRDAMHRLTTLAQ